MNLPKIPPRHLYQLIEALNIDDDLKAVENMLEYPDDIFRPLLELVLTDRLPLSVFLSEYDPHSVRALLAQGAQLEEGTSDEIVENAERFLKEGEPPDIYYNRILGQEVSSDNENRYGHPVHTRISRNPDKYVLGELEQTLARIYGINPSKIGQNMPGLHSRDQL